MAVIPKIPWHVIVCKARLDSFSQGELKAALDEAKQKGERFIALDMSNTRFVGLPIIKYVVQFAAELENDNGRLALLSPIEKTKRHFEIYGSLEHIEVIKENRSSQFKHSEARREEIPEV